MKKQKLQAGIYLYRGFIIQKEDMSENDVYPPSTVRWEIVKHDTGGTTCFGNSATLKKGTIDVDQMIENKRINSQVYKDPTYEQLMTKMVQDSPSIRQMFNDLGYATK